MNFVFNCRTVNATSVPQTPVDNSHAKLL